MEQANVVEMVPEPVEEQKPVEELPELSEDERVRQCLAVVVDALRRYDCTIMIEQNPQIKIAARRIEEDAKPN